MSARTLKRRFASGWRALSPSERRQALGILAAIAALNLAGWAIFLLAVLPRHFHYAGLGVGIGVAFTAWTLGCRHAFDADHIAAIDNVTRRLLAQGKRPLGSGFFFALGHASVVMLAGTGIALATRPVFHALVNPHSAFASAGGVAGTLISGTFLWLIGALNLIVMAGLIRVFRQMRGGDYDEARLEAHLQSRGLLSRLLGRWIDRIVHARQLFFIGFLFGIAFDTATEVLLMAGTAAAATEALPFYAVLALPLLFAGGLTLLDSFDGFFMNSAYGWAFSRPVRKVYYNLTVTGLSVVVAFAVGGIEIVGLLSQQLHLHGWLGDAMAGFDLNTAGYVIVGLFVMVWAGALAVWRLGHIEARWEAAALRARTPLAEPSEAA